jgi:hypothetical protein
MHQVSAKLEGKARDMIDRYLALPLGAKPSCPYFNNRRRHIRGGLRALKGKGTPEEIAEEAEIMAKLSRTDLSALSTDKLKEFLISKDLGVDCSGFAYHILNSLSQEKTGKSIQAFVRPIAFGIFAKVRAKFRPAENMGVLSFRNDINSAEIKPSEARPGDIVTFIGTGRDKTYNHILVITGVDMIEGDTRISYAHSYAWPSDGTSRHGVREGDILVHGDDILSGTWKEQGEIGTANYTYESAKNAKEVSIRRLKFLA